MTVSFYVYDILSKCFNMDGISYEEFQRDRLNDIHEDLQHYDMERIVLHTK